MVLKCTYYITHITLNVSQTGCTVASQLGFEPSSLVWQAGSPPTKPSRHANIYLHPKLHQKFIYRLDDLSCKPTHNRQKFPFTVIVHAAINMGGNSEHCCTYPGSFASFGSVLFILPRKEDENLRNGMYPNSLSNGKCSFLAQICSCVRSRIHSNACTNRYTFWVNSLWNIKVSTGTRKWKYRTFIGPADLLGLMGRELVHRTSKPSSNLSWDIRVYPVC